MRALAPAALNQVAEALLRGEKVLTLTDWRELSACRDSDPDLFFPIGSTGAAIDQIDRATAICGACLQNWRYR